MESQGTDEHAEGTGRDEEPRRAGASCLLWLMGLLLVVLVVIGALASTGKLSKPATRYDLPGGGTVEFTEIITGKTLEYTSGNRIQKLLRKFPPVVRAFMPPAWRSGSTISFGGRGGTAAGVVLTYRGATPGYNPSLQVADGRGWCSSSNANGMITHSADEYVSIHQLGLLPHDSPELQLRLFASSNPKIKEPIATLTVPNPMFNNPAPSAAPKAAPELESTSGDLTVRVLRVVTNVSPEDWDRKSTQPLEFGHAKKDAPGCTVIEWECLEDGKISADYRPSSGSVADAFGTEDWIWCDTRQIGEAKRYLTKLNSSLPESGPWYRLSVNFFHSKNFRADELWRVEHELPTTATTSAVITSNTLKGPLEVYTCGPGYMDPDLPGLRLSKDEYGVFVRDPMRPVIETQLNMVKAEIPGAIKYNHNTYGSTYVSRSGPGKSFMLNYWRLEPKRGSPPASELPTSVTLTFSVATARQMVFVVKPEQAK